MFGNVLEMKEAQSDCRRAAWPTDQTAALLSLLKGALERGLLTFFSFFILDQGCLVSTSSYFLD